LNYFCYVELLVEKAMLTTNNLTFRVGTRDLISNISLTFAPGKLHLIIGPNGAGKSTLIKVLARSLRPQVGTVDYDGVEFLE